MKASAFAPLVLFGLSLAMSAERRPRQPHPYVIGHDSVNRFLTVAEECARAGPLW